MSLLPFTNSVLRIAGLHYFLQLLLAAVVAEHGSGRGRESIPTNKVERCLQKLYDYLSSQPDGRLQVSLPHISKTAEVPHGCSNLGTR